MILLLAALTALSSFRTTHSRPNQVYYHPPVFSVIDLVEEVGSVAIIMNGPFWSVINDYNEYVVDLVEPVVCPHLHWSNIRTKQRIRNVMVTKQAAASVYHTTMKHTMMHHRTVMTNSKRCTWHIDGSTYFIPGQLFN